MQTPLPTQVHYGTLFSSECIAMLRNFNKRIAVLTDSHVKPLLGDAWCSLLQSHGLDAQLFYFEAGEGSKNRSTKERLEDEMLQKRFGRDSLLVALGGGVVTDLGGFLASTFCRGIPLVLVPTTLLAMVDAAIGGKNGVNTPHGKNLIGTYYLPDSVWIDTATLLTLPEREWRNGIAEVIKYGLIHSPPLFSKLFERIEAWHARDLTYIHELVAESIAIKNAIVTADFRESGYRRALNFGHTIAHALEMIGRFLLSHGEAVAIGMLIEGMLSQRMGFLKEGETEKIAQILQLYGFPLQILPPITKDQIAECVRGDKKAKNGNPRFVLLKKIGAVAAFHGDYCVEVDETLFETTLQEMGVL